MNIYSRIRLGICFSRKLIRISTSLSTWPAHVPVVFSRQTGTSFRDVLTSVFYSRGKDRQFELIREKSIDRTDERTILRLCISPSPRFALQVFSTERSCFAGIIFHEVVSFVHAASFRGESAASFRDGAESAATDVSSEGKGSQHSAGVAVDSM